MFSELPVRAVRDRLLILKSLPTLAGIGDEGLMVLAEHTRWRRFARGEVLLSELEAVESVHFLFAGSARITKEGEERAVIEAPGGIGFLAVLGGSFKTYTATAREPSTTLELPVRVVIGALHEHHDFLRNSLRLTANRLLAMRSSLPADPDNPPEIEQGEWRDQPLTLVQRMIGLRRDSLFASANIDAVIAMARLVREERFEAGTMVWRIGELPTFSLRIACGVIRCTSPDERTVDVGANYTVGGMEVFGDRPRAFSVETLTPVIAMRVERDDFLVMISFASNANPS